MNYSDQGANSFFSESAQHLLPLVGHLGDHPHAHRLADQGQRHRQIGQRRPQADLVSPVVTIQLLPEALCHQMAAAASQCKLSPPSCKLSPAPSTPQLSRIQTPSGPISIYVEGKVDLCMLITCLTNMIFGCDSIS